MIAFSLSFFNDSLKALNLLLFIFILLPDDITES